MNHREFRPFGIARKAPSRGLVSRLAVLRGYEVVEVGLGVLPVEVAIRIIHDVLRIIHDVLMDAIA